MTEQWWTKDEREAVTYAICDDSMDIADRGGIPIALWEEIDQEVGVALEALTPAIERIQREAKAEALREFAGVIETLSGLTEKAGDAYGAGLLNATVRDMRNRADRIEDGDD